MDIRAALRRARTRYDRADSERDEAIKERASVILAAAEAGWTRRAIAEDVGVSYTRVQQIIDAREERRAA